MYNSGMGSVAHHLNLIGFYTTCFFFVAFNRGANNTIKKGFTFHASSFCAPVIVVLNSPHGFPDVPPTVHRIILLILAEFLF